MDAMALHTVTKHHLLSRAVSNTDSNSDNVDMLGRGLVAILSGQCWEGGRS